MSRVFAALCILSVAAFGCGVPAEDPPATETTAGIGTPVTTPEGAALGVVDLPTSS